MSPQKIWEILQHHYHNLNTLSRKLLLFYINGHNIDSTSQHDEILMVRKLRDSVEKKTDAVKTGFDKNASKALNEVHSQALV